MRNFNPPTSQKDGRTGIFGDQQSCLSQESEEGLPVLRPPPSAPGKGNSTGKTRSSQEAFSREPLAWAGGIDMAGEELALTPDAAWMASPCDGKSILGLSFSISTLNRLHWMVFSTSCEPSEGRKGLIYSAPYASHNYCCCCCLVAQGCLTLCDPVDCSMPGLPVPHHLPEFTQTHVH